MLISDLLIGSGALLDCRPVRMFSQGCWGNGNEPSLEERSVSQVCMEVADLDEAGVQTPTKETS